MSSVMITGNEASDVFPEPSVASAVMRFAPSDNATPGNVQLPAASAVVVPTEDPSTNTSTVEPASAVPSIVIGDVPTV